MHVHASALSFSVVAAMVLIASFLMRLPTLLMPDSTIGKALAVLN